MYLMGFVNSTFETRRDTGPNLELVDLKYHPPEPVERRSKEHRVDLSNGHLPQNCNMIGNSCSGSDGNYGTVTSTKSVENGNRPLKTKPIARPARRTSLEDLPADLYMEPLSPLLLRSPEGVGARLQTTSWLPEETSVHWLKEDLASGGKELDQEWSFCIGKERKHTTSTTAWRMATTRWTSTFESVFADGGISIRVQHHPLETTSEDEDSDTSEDSRAGDYTIAGSSDREFCEEIGGDAGNVESLPKTDEGFARMLQHLESVEKDSVKYRKLPSPELPRDEDDAKLDIQQPGLPGVPIATPPRSSKLGGGNAEPHDLAKLSSSSPSLSSPVMEKMDAAASPEFPYVWNKMLPNRPKLAAMREPMREERDLRYPTPKVMTKSDSQDELSFRLWELDLENSQDSGLSLADEYANSKGGGDGSMDIVKLPRKLSPPNLDALLNLRTFDLRSRRRATIPKVEVEEGESEQDYPSPSSFTCGLSPTSLFSDDQGPFRLSVSSSDDNMFPTSFQKLRSSGVEGITASKSPRSVLSQQEPDEISHFTSDSSETSKPRKQTSVFKYLYNDESSDLESPMKGKTTVVKHHQPFPAFTYSVGKLDMGGTSSDEDPDEARVDGDLDVAHLAGSLQELGLFQEAMHRVPWLVSDGGVPDDCEDQPFPAFTYTVGKLDMEGTSSDEARDENVAHLAGSLQELGLFQDLNHRDPWLVNDGGVLDDSEDLEFLSLSPDSKRNLDTTSVQETSPLREHLIQSPAKEEIPEMADGKTGKHELSPRRPIWVPYVTGNLHGNDPPLAPNPGSRPQRKASVANFSEENAPKRSVNFAPDLVKEIPYCTTPAEAPNQPAPVPRANPNVTHEEEHATPQKVKSWEVEEEGPSIMTSRRRWRRNRDEQDSKFPGGSTRWRRNRDEQDSKSPGGSMRSSWSFAEARSRSRERVVPCAGRLFSWPRRFASKVSSSSRAVDSDDERSFVGGDQSFGMSSRRDAELVRRILKGSQKKYSNLTGADIMKEDFG